MTTNVPQDDELLIAMRRILPYIKDPTAYLHAEESIRRAELRAQRQQGAEPVGDWVMVPEDATNEIICAIEREVQSQCTASGVSEPLHRLDGQYIYAAMLTAAPTPPQANALVAAAYRKAAGNER